MGMAIDTMIINIIRTALISSAGILFILILKKSLFKEYTRNFNYYIWIIIIVRMLVPIRVPVYYNVPDNLMINKLMENSFIRETSLDVAEPANLQEHLSEAGEHSENKDIVSDLTVNLESVLKYSGYLWISVTLLIIAYRITSYIKLKNILIDLSDDINGRNQSGVENKENDKYREKVIQIYNELLKEMNITKTISLKFSECVEIPMGIGMFRSYIILPNRRYKEDDIIWILKHELMHYKKNDILYKFLLMAVVSIYWFNPLVYLMSKYINEDCELACDESVLADCNFNQRKNYALTLINSLKHNQEDSLKVNLSTRLGSKKILERRFDSMFNKKTKRGIVIGSIIVLIGICSLCTVAKNNIINLSGQQDVEASTGFEDDEISLYEIENNKYKGYYMEIKDPARIHVAAELEGKTVRNIVEENDAIAAINGGGYTDIVSDADGNIAQSTPHKSDGTVIKSIPVGLVMSGGKCVYNDADADEKQSVFAMTGEGQLLVGDYSLNELLNINAQEALSFEPALIVNGEMTDMLGDGGWGIAPRTAIGQKKDGTIIFLVIDGRSIESLGATVKEVQEIMYKLGAVNAINLDGGRSSTMCYDGEIINELHTGEERKVPSAVIVK